MAHSLQSLYKAWKPDPYPLLRMVYLNLQNVGFLLKGFRENLVASDWNYLPVARNLKANFWKMSNPHPMPCLPPPPTPAGFTLIGALLLKRVNCPPFLFSQAQQLNLVPRSSGNGALTCRGLHFRRRFLVEHTVLPNLVISNWLWWIMRVLLAN